MDQETNIAEAAGQIPPDQLPADQEQTDFHERMAALLEEDYDYTQLRRGDVIDAVILSITDHDIVVDLGTKRDGIVTSKDLSFVDDEYVEKLEVGDRIPVAVHRTWGHPDGIVVSLNKGLQQEDWLKAEEMLESGEVFEGEVVDFNRGGVIVPFGRLRGFVPNSHLTSLPSGLREGRFADAKSELVGKQLRLGVIEVNPRRRRLVLSKRAADRRLRSELLEELEQGQVRTGIVRNLVDFGAFVDLGGVDGLIHISELDWRHVDHPSDVLSLGEEVEVEVISVDIERQRIGLSRKRLMPDPWFHVVENLSVDDVVEGTVTNVVPFGVFVDVGDGVEGLVHTSEMPRADIVAMGELVPGSTAWVRILEIDNDKHQLALRLEPPWPETQEESREDLDELAEPGAVAAPNEPEETAGPEDLDELPEPEVIREADRDELPEPQATRETAPSELPEPEEAREAQQAEVDQLRAVQESEQGHVATPRTIQEAEEGAAPDGGTEE